MTRLGRLAGEVWALTRGYWVSEERWSARALLVAILGLNLGLVGVNVLQNEANGALFTSLQRLDAPGFYRALIVVVLLIVFYLGVAVLRVYLDQMLQLRWRRWMTDQFLSQWLADRAFYRMRFSGSVDNPDQRISEDIRLFIERSMALGLGLLNSLATLGSFAALLWYLSGSITIPIGSFGITIPGYMFWIAVVYSALGSALAHWIGRPLILLNNRQQAFEADFRFSLVRLREEAEGIALYRGEMLERRIAMRRFTTLFDNFKRIIVRNNQYLMFQLLFSQGTSSFALLVGAPRYFAGAVQLGVLTQTANAFERVNEALSWFIGSYTAFAQWKATVDRLTEFHAAMTSDPINGLAGARVETAAQETIDLQDVGVSLPDGQSLLAPLTLTFNPHEGVLLRGTSGCGKSTLFRVIAGLWPFANGIIRLPAGKYAVLPQRPYMPIGTLRDALWFPIPPAANGDADARAALEAVGLSALSGRLDEEAHWSQLLSLGEQQRLAIARALLVKPDWLFLDEATSATDESEEVALYGAVERALPLTTVVSIGHRGSLEASHRRVIAIVRALGQAGRLVDRAGGLPGARVQPEAPTRPLPGGSWATS